MRSVQTVLAAVLGLTLTAAVPAEQQFQGQTIVNGVPATFNNNLDEFLKALDGLPLDADQKAKLKELFQKAQPGKAVVPPQLPKKGVPQGNGVPMNVNNLDELLKAIDNLPLDADQKAQLKEFFKNAPLGNGQQLPLNGQQFEVNINGMKMTFNSLDELLKAIDNLPIDADQKAQLKEVFQNAPVGNGLPLPIKPIPGLGKPAPKQK